MISPPLNYISLAIPFFLLFMLAEYLFAKKKRLHYFNLHNTIANISIGIGERMADVLVSGSFYFVYDHLQHKYGWFHIQSSPIIWILLFLATDFVWYWYHRLAHELNIFWAVHVVHHQSEDFNYTVSARITVMQSVIRAAFWSVLPLLGFPASMITVMLLLHGLYPFFIHTRLIGKLGWLEYVLVTPSHHRVHHASDEKYLDKNYGDVLIIWDKLFGTFKVEEEEPSYGLTKPLHTYSYLWQHFHFMIELAIAVYTQPTIKGKIRILFGGPDLIDPEIREKAERFFNIRQAQSKLAHHLNTYVIWQVGVLLIATFVFILYAELLSSNFKFWFTCLVVLTLINCGAIMEQKKWIFNVEFIRLTIIVLIIWPYTENNIGGVTIIYSGLALIILWYKTAQSRYLNMVYAPHRLRN